MQILVSGDDVLAGFANYGSSLGRIGLDAGLATLNTLGPLARKEMVKAEARATGLSAKLLGRALHETRATRAAPVYVIFSAGGEISLRHFNARETREGVSARVLGETKVFAGTFMKAGGFLRRPASSATWRTSPAASPSTTRAERRPARAASAGRSGPVRGGALSRPGRRRTASIRGPTTRRGAT